MLKIGEFSKLSKVTVKALRYYDKVGLLRPACVDAATSYRYYREEQLATVRQIMAYKAAGLTSEEIAALLRGDGTLTRDFLRQKRRELCEAQAALDRQIGEIDRMLAAPTGDSAPMLKTVPECLCYCCRETVSSPEGIPAFIQTAHRDFKRQYPAIGFPAADYCCVIYPGTAYRENDLPVEYVQQVEQAGEASARFSFRRLPEITAVSVTHRGGYDTLRDAYLLAVSYALEKGYALAGSARERYMKGIWNCQSEDEWLTEVQLPIAVREETRC